MSKTTRYELVEHTADLALRVTGGDLAELLANLAWAVCDQLADASRVEVHVAIPLSLTAPDRESLVVALANELIYQREAEDRLLPLLDVAVAETTHLVATARGERADATRHALKTGLKAATWHALSVRDTSDGGLEAFVVFDV